MSRVPGMVRAAVLLMWSVGPIGLVVSVTGVLALWATLERLGVAAPPRRGYTTAVAIRYMEAYGWRRVLIIASLFAVATVVYGLLARAVRHGGGGRPGAITVLAGTLFVIFACVCLWIHQNPAAGFTAHPGPHAIQLTLVPSDTLVMDEAVAAWYRPIVGRLLLVAVAAQFVATVLVTRTRSTAWLGRPGPEDARATARSARLTRRAGMLLLPALAVLPAYALINRVAARQAWNAGYRQVSPADTPLATFDGGTVLALWFIGVPAAAVATYGLILLLERENAPGRGVPAAGGGLTVVYLLVLWFFTVNDPSEPYLFPDDQSGLTQRMPPWHEPALYTLFTAALICQATALLALALRREAT